eukprot:4823416-Prymnesium_polylepis.1
MLTARCWPMRCARSSACEQCQAARERESARAERRAAGAGRTPRLSGSRHRVVRPMMRNACGGRRHQSALCVQGHAPNRRRLKRRARFAAAPHLQQLARNPAQLGKDDRARGGEREPLARGEDREDAHTLR